MVHFNISGHIMEAHGGTVALDIKRRLIHLFVCAVA